MSDLGYRFAVAALVFANLFGVVLVLLTILTLWRLP